MVPDQWSFGTQKLLNLQKDGPVQNTVRLLYNSVQHFRTGKHLCLSLNLNSHRINCKCSISLNIHQNQVNPYLFFFLCFYSQ